MPAGFPGRRKRAVLASYHRRLSGEVLEPRWTPAWVGLPPLELTAAEEIATPEAAPLTAALDATAAAQTYADVPYYGGAHEWNLNAINAPEAWAHGHRGQGVVVAVIDTGVDINHPDLMTNLWVNSREIPGNGKDDDGNGFVDDVHGWDFVDRDNRPDDAHGHGTHVAGTIAADDNRRGVTGVAPDAKIMPIRVLGSNGSGSSSDVAAGIRYAAQMGADVINLSLGGALSTSIQAAVQYAEKLGVLVVAAAGNDAAGMPSYPARFSASLTNVISVGAHNSNNTSASFSNDVGGSRAVQVDAPGVAVVSTYTDGRYARLNGTSMATPHVAGLAALALSANPKLTPGQLRNLIVEGSNRSIIGSDARGGINAAVTVALAEASVPRKALPTTRTVYPVTTDLLTRVKQYRNLDLKGLASDNAHTVPAALPVETNLAATDVPADLHRNTTAPAAVAARTTRAAYDQALQSLLAADERATTNLGKRLFAATLVEEADAWLEEVYLALSANAGNLRR